MMVSKFDKMKMPPRKMKGQPEPEEIKLEIGMGDDMEEAPMSDEMDVETGANLEVPSASDMIEELKKQGILPPDFKNPKAAEEAPPMEEDELSPPVQATGAY